MRDRFGVDVQAMHGDDGIVLRLPDLELDDVDGVRERGVGRELLDLVTLDPDDVRGLVTDEIGGSALFAARFRECAARALLLPRRRPDRRQPLWQQRQRASQLLEVASQYPTFPIVLEAVRECVQDVFDVPGLVDLMRDIGSRRVTVVDVESSTPLAVREVAAVRLRRAVPLRGRLAAGRAPGRRPGPRPQPARRAARHQRGAGAARPARRRADRPHRGRAAAAHPRAGGPRRRRRRSTCCARSGRCRSTASWPAAARAPPATTSRPGWPGCTTPRQVIAVRVAGEDRWSAIDDAVPAARRARRLAAARACRRPSSSRCADPLGDLVARYARTHVPFHAAEVARAYGLGPAVAHARPGPAGVVGPASSRASCCPPAAAAPSSATPRCCGCCAAARWPPCAPRSSRSPRSSCPASCSAGRASAAGCAGATACCASSSSSAAPCCRPAPSSPSCCPPGSPTTPPPCSTS